MLYDFSMSSRTHATSQEVYVRALPSSPDNALAKTGGGIR